MQRETMMGLLVAGLLSGTGCLRFAYDDRQPSHTADAGMDGGQQLPTDAGGAQGDAQTMAAGSGGSDAAAWTGGMSGRAAGGGGAAGRVGVDAGDAGGFDAATPEDAGTTDASAPDAAGGDAGSRDGGVDAGVPGSDQTAACLERPGVLLCNGFETYPFTPQWEFNIIDNGVAELSTERRHSGVGALRATTISAREGTAVRLSSRVLAQKRSGDIWMRYQYYVPSTTQITTWISSGVMSELDPPYDGVDLLIHANYVEIESMLGYFDEGVPFPRDRWVCVELHTYVDDTSGYFEAFLDGVRVAKSGTGDTLPATGYTAAEFGIHYAEYRQGPVEVYVDDVAVGTARIGCE